MIRTPNKFTRNDIPALIAGVLLYTTLVAFGSLVVGAGVELTTLGCESKAIFESP